jgi:glycosyltransferase involved in cell wall biosynthesis
MRVAGYFKGVMGTGEHARQLLDALRTQGIPVATTTLRPDGSPEDADLATGYHGLEGADDAGALAGFNLLCANADMVPAVAEQLGDAFFGGRYTIGFWAWEVASFPRQLLPAFEHVDEVWVGSRHVHDAVAQIATVPVVAIPQPVSMPDDAADVAPPPGLPDGFRFLFAFDYFSVFERKNPLATIEAFKRAFEPGSGAALIVKAMNDHHDPSAHELVRAAAASHPDVRLLEGRLSRSERDGLMNAADCYVSLHRAEGFGYTLAESMWLGKPVIGTGYSGNLDFMTDQNSFLVDYRLVPTGAGHDPYPPEGLWADPDIDHAARLMREVFEHREEASRRGERAAAEIRASHGLDAAGRAMRERLELLSVARAGRMQPPDSGGLGTERARELIDAGPVPPAAPRFGAPQRFARKGLLRLLKPVTVHERLVAAELLEAIESLESRVGQLEAELRRARAERDIRS